jgi:uncharacterized linocin/CFP29 family protein
VTIESGLPWSPEQWASIQSLIQETARRTRVAASFLPLVGPLPPGQAYVPAQRMTVKGPPRGPFAVRNHLNVDDHQTLPLVTITSPVYLKVNEAEDPSADVARQMFAQTTQVLARLEDAIIFNGLGTEFKNQPGRRDDFDGRSIRANPLIYSIWGGENVQFEGIIKGPDRGRIEILVGPFGQGVVNAVSEAVMKLEDSGYYGPFACVLGQDLFLQAQPTRLYAAAPSDRISPFLSGGPFLRSSAIDPDRGAVIALGAAAVDLVVGSDLSAKFIQLSEEPRYVVAVSETVRLRIKDDSVRDPSQRPFRILVKQ